MMTERKEFSLCGRYYVDDEIAREIGQIVWAVDRNVKGKRAAWAEPRFQAKDIHPTETAPVLMAAGQELECGFWRWGFPGFQGKQVIFNARSESVWEKKTFRESIGHRRIVVPATWFYEWSRNKEKNIFYRKDERVLFMAGIYNRYQDGERFAILTTQANDSMKPVHDRMPLILEKSEIMPWIFEDKRTEEFLHKEPCLLKRRTDYEQLSLF